MSILSHTLIGLGAISAGAVVLGAAAGLLARDRRPRWVLSPSGVAFRLDRAPSGPAATHHTDAAVRFVDHVAAANEAILAARAAHAARHRPGADDLDGRFVLLPWEAK